MAVRQSPSFYSHPPYKGVRIMNAQESVPEEIVNVIELFKSEYGKLHMRCLDPQKVQGYCSVLTSEFNRFLSQTAPSIPHDEMVVEGCHAWQNHSWDHEPRFEVYWHQLNKVGAYYIDWTIRQFDITANVPAIYTESELRSIWKSVWTVAEYDIHSEAKLKKRCLENGVSG